MRGIPDGVLRRYIEVVQPGRRPGAWYHQPRYGMPFRPGARPLKVADVRRVLTHDRHVAVYAPTSGRTDYVAFDIDCKDGNLPKRNERYWAIRDLIGADRVPLVYATPSGAGLRVRYRIPSTQLERLITGRRTGLLADVLRAAGLPVLDGSIEIFPQRDQADRLPLGNRMPLLDPLTLEPLRGAAIGAEYDEVALCGAVNLLEEWHGVVYHDLVAHLQSLPGEPVARVAVAGRATGREEFLRVGSRVRPSDDTLALIHGGLKEPSSRYRSEYRVALAGVLSPVVLRPFGLRDVHDDEDVAEAVARWLAEKHNGLSKDWHDSIRRTTTEGAIAKWKASYLTRSGVTGLHFVDRIREAADRLDGSLRNTLLISDDERREVIQLADAAGLSGSTLYRAEVWLAASRRAIKSIVRHHLKAGVPLDEVDDGGHRFVFAPIAARWMEDWPYGSGVCGRGGPDSTANYVRYRKILIDARWMRLARFSPGAVAFRNRLRLSGRRLPTDVTLEASTYAVRMPRMDVRVRDVGVDALRLQSVLTDSGLEMSGRGLGLDEAHHILWLAGAGIRVRQRYGYRLGVRLEQTAHLLRTGLAARTCQE